MQADAQAILDASPYGYGHSHIEVDRGDADRYVSLVDPGPITRNEWGREGMAAMSIEMGRGPQNDDGSGGMDPVAPLQRAAGFMVTNFPRSRRKNKQYPKAKKKGGGKKRG
jgi:hypothetical protein